MTDRDNIANLMGMAGTAERAKNNVEAIAYYNRVLEADPTVSDAWLGKGRASGWLSTLSNMRLTETTVAFGHAIATASADRREETVQRAADDATDIILALYNSTARHFLDFAELPTSRAEFFQRSSALSDALEDVRAWLPNHIPALVQTASISRGVLNIGTSPELDRMLRDRMDSANTMLRTMVPDFQPAPLDEKTLVEIETVANATAAQKAEESANWNAIGYVVLFIVIIIGAVIRGSQ